MPETMDTTYGAMLIGVLFATFFQSVLTLQAYIYFENFPRDSIKLKTLVASVWILDIAHLVLISQSCYHYLITSWGNNNAELLVSTKPLDLHLVFVGLATWLCQGFFLYRIWTFSRKNWFLAGVLGAALIPSVATFASVTGEVVVVFAIGAGVDVAIALILVFCLQQNKTGVERLLAVACLIAVCTTSQPLFLMR
ncbi:hypothetical protein C8J57DRAFT_1605107 [Mycena rebaudengoi]|nr:hypothetical protein C8J57DRAFT_1605107 [Mycena rebaudengoi]